MATTTDYFLQGFNSGANVAGEGLRLQELKSQAALRRMQEARAAKEMEMMVAENDRQIQYRADMFKAVQTAQFAASPVVHLPGMGVVPNPNPMTQSDAAYRFVLPVIGKHDPVRVPAAMQDIAMSEYRSRAGAMVSDFQPSTKIITDENGRQITVLEKRPGSWDRVPESAAERQNKGFDNQQRMSVFKFALDKAPHLMKLDEKGMPFLPPENFPEAARLAGITTSTRGDLQGTEVASDDVFALGRKLFPMINDQTTSVATNLKRIVRDSPAAVFLPSSFIPSAEATEADAVARNFMSGIVRNLRSDGNITGAEAKALQDEANTTRWVDEKTGKTRVKAFVQLAARKARDASTKLGVPINEKYLTFEEIGQRADARVEAGKMTPEEAMNWAVETYNKSAEAMIRDFDEQISRLGK